MFYRLLRLPRPASGVGQFARIEDYPQSEHAWLVGERFFTPPVEPMRCVLRSGGSRVLPDLYLSSIPLFSERLLKGLRAAGVDNLEDYRAQLYDPDTDTTLGAYRAVNVIGKVQCVDMEHSEFEPTSAAPMLELTRLAIDDAKAGDALLFRLAENPLFIIVGQRIKDAFQNVEMSGLAIASFDEPRAYY